MPVDPTSKPAHESIAGEEQPVHSTKGNVGHGAGSDVLHRTPPGLVDPGGLHASVPVSVLPSVPPSVAPQPPLLDDDPAPPVPALVAVTAPIPLPAPPIPPPPPAPPRQLPLLDVGTLAPLVLLVAAPLMPALLAPLLAVAPPVPVVLLVAAPPGPLLIPAPPVPTVLPWLALEVPGAPPVPVVDKVAVRVPPPWPLLHPSARRAPARAITRGGERCTCFITGCVIRGDAGLR